MKGLTAQLGFERESFALDVEVRVQPGEVVALLGPNGAGKSTLLRILAGLLPLRTGRITLGDRTLADADLRVHHPPHQRSIGLVFQDYLLFPHLSVLDNVAFGPLVSGISKTGARRRARAGARAQATIWLERLGITDLAAARPRNLSGGQAQRVALARALAGEPELLMLDEPLAALDARTRLLVRGELRRHLADFGGAVVLVTHDPVDASVLADRLIVIEHGRVVQQGAPKQVASRPQTDYVARLVGLNLLSGEAEEYAVRVDHGGVVRIAEPASGSVYVAFPPVAVSLFTERPEGSPRNVWSGQIAAVEPHGEGVRVEVAGVPSPGSSILAEVTPAAVVEADLRPGGMVWASVKASEVEVYPRT